MIQNLSSYHLPTSYRDTSLKPVPLKPPKVQQNDYKWGTVPQLIDFLAGTFDAELLDEAHIKSMNEKIFESPVEAILSENFNKELLGVDSQGNIYTKSTMLKRVNRLDVDHLTYKQYVQQINELGLLQWWTTNILEIQQFTEDVQSKLVKDLDDQNHTGVKFDKFIVYGQHFHSHNGPHGGRFAPFGIMIQTKDCHKEAMENLKAQLDKAGYSCRINDDIRIVDDWKPMIQIFYN